MEPENIEDTNGSKEPSKPNMVQISGEELQRMQKELTEYKDKYLRVLAEMENTRKRLNKEREEYAQMAIADVITEFLKPLDHMEKALHFADHMSPEVQNWANGFHMILNQFRDILTANDVTAVIAHGEPFDPHHHEAIETQESDDHAPGTVMEEYSRGYKMGGRTIRPARVKVAKEKKSPASDQTESAGEADHN